MINNVLQDSATRSSKRTKPRSQESNSSRLERFEHKRSASGTSIPRHRMPQESGSEAQVKSGNGGKNAPPGQMRLNAQLERWFNVPSFQRTYLTVC